MKVQTAAEIGHIDEKGHWSPNEPIHYAPIFQWPIKPVAILKFLFGWGGLIWPVNLICVGLGFLTYYVLQPDMSQTMTLQPGWIAQMLLRNFIYLWIVYGGLHYILYIRKLHGTERKYHPEWQSTNNKKFTFKNQVRDNIFWSNVSGLFFWTAYEVLYVWAASNGKVPLITWKQHPVWFVALFFVIILIREVHFYLIHRLIHTEKLFKYVHSLHHRNNNVAPWSGMSMHPVEHLAYMSVLLIHFVIPSSPVHFFFHTVHLTLTPASGHTGFEGPLFNGKMPSGSYFHYPHHKYVNCNFGMEIIPMDKWFGNFYDGAGKFKFLRKKH